MLRAAAWAAVGGIAGHHSGSMGGVAGQLLESIGGGGHSCGVQHGHSMSRVLGCM
jgi:hypothetical protein